MTKAELIAQVAEEAKVKKVEADKAINSFIRIVSAAIKSQGQLALAGFGTFYGKGAQGPGRPKSPDRQRH